MSNDFAIQQLRSMMQSSPLDQVREIRQTGAVAPGEAAKTEGPAFSDMLKDSIEEVNDLKIEADQAIVNLAAGKSDDIQGTIMALEKADVSFKLMMEVRNKIVSAYQEVMRTQV
jgi:flagellar hook-basal body complex protein FliE